jgi:hypothetical protein
VPSLVYKCYLRSIVAYLSQPSTDYTLPNSRSRSERDMRFVLRPEKRGERTPCPTGWEQGYDDTHSTHVTRVT